MSSPEHERAKSCRRPYQPDDLKSLTKKKLEVLIREQPNNTWLAGKRRFNPSTTKRDTMCAILLDPANRFSTAKTPLPQAEDHPIAPFSPSSGVRIFPAMADPDPADCALMTPKDVGHSVGGVGGLLPPLVPPPLPSPVAGLAPSNFPVDGGRSQSQVQCLPLHVFIEDQRLSVPRKTAVELQVEPADFGHCKPGEWRVHAREVILKLQQTHAALQGLSQFTCPPPCPVEVAAATPCRRRLPRYSPRREGHDHAQVRSPKNTGTGGLQPEEAGAFLHRSCFYENDIMEA